MRDADLHALRSPDPAVRARALEALAAGLPQHGGGPAAAAPAVPLLLELADDARVLSLLSALAVGDDAQVLPHGVPDRYAVEPVYAAVAEGVPRFRELLAADGLAAHAAVLLAWFPAHAEASLAALWARLGTGAAGGAALAAIGLLGESAARIEPYLRDGDPARRWGATIALARAAGDERVLDPLVRAACGDVPRLEPPGVVFMGGEMHRYAAASLKLLDPALRPAAVERIARSLAQVDGYTALALVDALLALAFPGRVAAGTPFAALERHQQQALRGLMTARWFVIDSGYSNVPFMLDGHGLPTDARALDGYIRGKRRLG